MQRGDAISVFSCVGKGKHDIYSVFGVVGLSGATIGRGTRNESGVKSFFEWSQVLQGREMKIKHVRKAYGVVSNARSLDEAK